MENADDMCWWCCKTGVTQTREHLVKVCTIWKKQQKFSGRQYEHKQSMEGIGSISRPLHRRTLH